MGFRRNRRAVGEVNQSLAALVVIMMCVGLVMVAVHGAVAAAGERAAREHARAQGEVFTAAAVEDGALAGKPGTLSITKARDIAAGRAGLGFSPEAVKVVTIRAVAFGSEVWLKGNAEALDGSLEFVVRPVAVELDNGTVAPGLLRAGVALE